MSFPCGYCGVRPDVACKHRPASTEWKAPEQKSEDEGKRYRYNPRAHAGLNMRTRTYRNRQHGA